MSGAKTFDAAVAEEKGRTVRERPLPHEYVALLRSLGAREEFVARVEKKVRDESRKKPPKQKSTR